MQIIAPTNCPACESDLERVKDQMFCRNKACPAQTSQLIQNYCKKLKIKGFGPATVDKLGIVTLAELYCLTAELCELKEISTTVANKLVTQVQGSKILEFGSFISAVGIPLIGETVGRKLATVINSPFELDELTCKKAGLGPKATVNLLKWKRLQWDTSLKELPITFTESKQTTTSVEIKGEVCITGKLDNFKNRAAAAIHLVELGFIVKSSVTKSVSYLVCEDATKLGSSSYKKAEALGIPIVTIDELLTL